MFGPVGVRSSTGHLRSLALLLFWNGAIQIPIREPLLCGPLNHVPKRSLHLLCSCGLTQILLCLPLGACPSTWSPCAARWPVIRSCSNGHSICCARAALHRYLCCVLLVLYRYRCACPSDCEYPLAGFKCKEPLYLRIIMEAPRRKARCETEYP